MEPQILTETVAVALAAIAPPVIMFVVEVIKTLSKAKGKIVPQIAASVGAILGVVAVVEIAGVSAINIIAGISAGITIGYAAVGVHGTIREKSTDQSGAYID